MPEVLSNIEQRVKFYSLATSLAGWVQTGTLAGHQVGLTLHEMRLVA